jgi:hypothetical protein
MWRERKKEREREKREREGDQGVFYVKFINIFGNLTDKKGQVTIASIHSYC